MENSFPNKKEQATIKMPMEDLALLSILSWFGCQLGFILRGQVSLAAFHHQFGIGFPYIPARFEGHVADLDSLITLK